MANQLYNPDSKTFNQSEIMRAAWSRIPACLGNRKQRFALSLSIVWAQAVAEKRASQRTEVENQIDALESQITLLHYKPLSYNISAEQNRLRAEINKLAA